VCQSEQGKSAFEWLPEAPDHADRLNTVRGVTDRYFYEKGRVVLHNGIVTSKTIGTLR